ncbi:MAG: hypothetical protein NPINA01_19340 [Nitrospinaceae bacterium]|nr:MAG: hypothetical protein NPINA01_19340 [Nitrospinaceae bacterium]
MELSGLGNASTAPKTSTAETVKSEGEGSKQTAGAAESKSSVSLESQTSPVPPANPTSESGNEAAPLPNAESNTGGKVNVTV